MPTVIKVENLSKYYRLGLIGGKTLHDDLNRWWARVRKQPDPLLKIGQEDRQNGNGEYLWALRDINFEVQQGEIVGIIGRNGAGKSTLLKILSRITAPTSGQVKVKGRIASLLEVGTGFHPELTGRENIYLNGAILGMKKAEIDRKFDEIVDFSGVEKFIDTPVKRYSSGMKVRLAFAVAAHLEPEILLIDEVLAVGDVEFQKKCLGKMGDVAKEGRTVLFVSHNMGAITNLCPQAFLLNSGKILLSGKSSEVVCRYLNLITTDEGAEVILAKIPSDAFFYKISVVTADGKATRFVEVTADFRIRFEYEVSRALDQLEASFGLFDRNGSKVFYSGNSKSKTRNNLNHKPGYHIAEARIPANFLAPGMYTITAGLHQPNVHLFDRREHVVGFTVVETGSADYKYSGQDLGAILVQLDWNTCKKNGIV